MTMISAKISDELKELLSGENVNIQLSVPQLVEKAISRGEAQLLRTGRSQPKQENIQVVHLKINTLLRKRLLKTKSIGVT